MDPAVVSVTSEGRYYWELVFDYDNSENTGSIQEKIQIKKHKIVNSKEFLSTKFNVNSGFTYKNSSSFALQFDGAKVGSNLAYGFHIEIANEMVESSQTGKTIDESTEIDRTFDIGPHGKLSLYRLCYITDGASLKTDIVSTVPEADIIVHLEFSCLHRILGLQQILDTLLSIHPGSSNIGEWDHVRNSIIKNSYENQQQQFYQLVRTLGIITPGRDNTVEWSRIRETCSEILIDWVRVDKILLFRKLLERLGDTIPGRDNKGEWSTIRNVCHNILSNMEQLF